MKFPLIVTTSSFVEHGMIENILINFEKLFCVRKKYSDDTTIENKIYIILKIYEKTVRMYLGWVDVEYKPFKLLKGEDRERR